MSPVQADQLRRDPMRNSNVQMPQTENRCSGATTFKGPAQAIATQWQQYEPKKQILTTQPTDVVHGTGTATSNETK